MTASTLYDAVIFRTATTGTGTLTAGSAVSRYRTPAQASVADGSTVSYRIDDDNGGWEFGRGTYTVSGTTLARTTILGSSNSGSAISLSGGATVTFVALSSDIDWATLTHAATGKTTPVDADELSIVDSAVSNVIKKLTWANLKATLKTYFDTLYGSGGGWTLLSTLTASSSASLSDTTSLTSTYDLYAIGFDHIVAASDNVIFEMQVSTDNGSTWKTTSYVATMWSRTFAVVNINTFIPLSGNDTSTPAGTLTNTINGGYNGLFYLFDVSNTTTRKAFYGTAGACTYDASSSARFETTVVNGYWDGGNTAINGVKFFMSSGNIASGKIRIYGVKTS